MYLRGTRPCWDCMIKWIKIAVYICRDGFIFCYTLQAHAYNLIGTGAKIKHPGAKFRTWLYMSWYHGGFERICFCYCTDKKQISGFLFTNPTGALYQDIARFLNKEIECQGCHSNWEISMNNYHIKRCDMITNPRPNVTDSVNKPPLKWTHGLVITPSTKPLMSLLFHKKSGKVDQLYINKVSDLTEALKQRDCFKPQ